MTSDDLDTWQAMYGMIEDAESDIHFVLDNRPEAQTDKNNHPATTLLT